MWPFSWSKERCEEGCADCCSHRGTSGGCRSMVRSNICLTGQTSLSITGDRDDAVSYTLVRSSGKNWKTNIKGKCA